MNPGKFFRIPVLTIALALFLATLCPAKMIIRLNDGRTIPVNVNRADISSIIFQDSAEVAPPPATGAITWDFETGNLSGWEKTGAAFDSQPTYGDNATARARGQASRHQDHFWIGTYEDRRKPTDPPGRVQGDGPLGTLTSVPFPIQSGAISFLVGGGCDINTERVELLINDQAVLKATGQCSETMQRVKWDVSPWLNQTARIRIVDESAGGWGHINFDDLRFE